MLIPARVSAFRREILGLIEPNLTDLAAQPTNAFVWPTETCSIGCAHCNFASKRRREADDPVLRAAPLFAWLTQARARTVVVCGGGEPLDEPEFCRELIALCGRSSMNFGIYTSGRSLDRPAEPEQYIREWKLHRGEHHKGEFHLRLSLDAFHADRIGTGVVAQWVAAVERAAPEWRLSLRALRVTGDDTVAELAELLGAHVSERAGSTARITLRGGTVIPVERMGFVLDGRGTAEVLTRRGLALSAQDESTLRPWRELLGRPGGLGRPLSRRLTVGRRRLDLEIHADAGVEVLETQPHDTRLAFTECHWPVMRGLYYRDPVVHAVSTGGLDLVAELLRPAFETGVADRSAMPFSVGGITDPALLDWLTAAAVTRLAERFGYPSRAVELASGLLGRT